METRERPLLAVFCGYVCFMRNEMEKLKLEIEAGARVISLSGLTSVSAKAYLLSRLRAETGRRFAVVAESNSDLETWSSDLDLFGSQISNFKFEMIQIPSFTADPYSGVSPHAETQERRALGLWQLQKASPEIVILSSRSLIQRTVTRDEVAALGRVVIRDTELPLDELLETLIKSG